MGPACTTTNCKPRGPAARRGFLRLLGRSGTDAGSRFSFVHSSSPYRLPLPAGRMQALPTTFGLKAAGWLVSVFEARRRLLDVRSSGLAAQLGGQPGRWPRLAVPGPPFSKGSRGSLVSRSPYYRGTRTEPESQNSGLLYRLSPASLGKISLDVVLMAQTEVGELHKRNPILSVTAVASTRRVQDLSGTLQAAMVGEHERAADAWHAEWETLSDALALTGGAAAATREALEGLQVHTDRMRENLGATGDLLLSEHVTTILAERFGRLEAHELVKAASRLELWRGGRSLREELLAEPALREALSPEEIDAALDPACYLGSGQLFVDPGRSPLYRAEVSV